MLFKRQYRQFQGNGDIVFLVRIIFIFVVISSERAKGWQVNVENQDKTCFLYKPRTKTCFIQSHVGGIVTLNLHITPDPEAGSGSHQLPPISWFRRVKMQKRFVLKVVDLLVGGRPPSYMILSPNRTSLTILALHDYDVFRNSFKATVGSGEERDHQNFVIESIPVVLKEPPPGEYVAVHTQDYILVGSEAQFEWKKEGSLSLPREVYIDPTATTLIIEHYNPVEDAGVYVCDAYNSKGYFVAGRRFVLGKAVDDKTASGRVSKPVGNAWDSENLQPHHEEYGTDAPFHQESQGPTGNDDVAAGLEIPPVDIDEMLHTFQDDGDFAYVLQGRTQYLACLPSNMAPINRATPGLKFTWGRPKSKGHDVIMVFDHDRYFTIDGGILQISSVDPVDSGKLECEVSFRDPGKGTERKKTFTYNIEVYTLPDLIYSISAGYATPDCNDQQSSVFKQQLGTHLQSSIIAIDVSFQISNLVALCAEALPGSVGGVHPGLRGHGARLLVRFDVIIRHEMIAECSLSCMTEEMNQRMGLIESKIAAFFNQQTSNAMYVQDITRLASVEHSLQYHCSTGYGLHASLCVACQPGRYSRAGRVKCSQCPVGTYQASHGAGDCSPCPPNQITLLTGSTSSKQCRVKSVVIASILGGVVLWLLAVFVLSFILRRLGRENGKKLAEQHELVAILTNSDTDEDTTDTESERKHTSRTEVSRAAHKSELVGLLDGTSSDEDTPSQIYRTAALVDQSTADDDEEVDILNVRRQESKQDQDDAELDSDFSIQNRDVLVSFASPPHEDSVSELESSESGFEYADQVRQVINEPIDNFAQSQITNDLVQIDQPQSLYHSLHHLAYDEPIVPQYTPHPKTSVEAQLASRHSWVPIDHPHSSYHSAHDEHVHQAYDEPTLPRPQQYLETSLPSKHSSHVHSLPRESFHRGQPSHQQFPREEEVYTSRTFLPPLSNASLVPRSPSTGRRPTPPIGPSLISMDSRAISMPFRTQTSPSSSEPESPRSRSRSPSFLPAPVSDPYPRESLLRPPDLSDSDSEIEIENSVAEQARLSPREDTYKSSKSYLPRSSFVPVDSSESDSEFEIESREQILPREDILRSRSSSKPRLPKSSSVLQDLVDSDYEVEIENFVSEKDHNLPRENIPRSRSSSKPQLPKSSSVLHDLVNPDSEVEIESFISEKDHNLPREDILRSRSSSRPQSSIVLHDLVDSNSKVEIQNFVSERDYNLPREDFPRSRSSSKPQLPKSSIVLQDLVDSDSEVEIENFVSEKDHNLPRDDILRSRSSSRPQSSIVLHDLVDSNSKVEIENFVSERDYNLPREDFPRSRSSSKPQLPKSSIVLPEHAASYFDSEVKTENFVPEIRQVPRQESLQSVRSSKPETSPHRSSVSGLIASYQSLSRAGPTPSPPSVASLISPDFMRSSGPSSPKASAILSPGLPNTIPSLIRSSASESVREDQTQSIHSHRATSGSIEPEVHTDSYSLMQSPGGTSQQSQSSVLTPPSSNNEYLSDSKFEQGPKSSIISVQKSVLSAEDPTLARRSSHFTSPSGRPMNPFKQQRLRRESLAAEVSSHHTSTSGITSQQSLAHHPQASIDPAKSESVKEVHRTASIATPTSQGVGFTPPAPPTASPLSETPPPPSSPNVKKASTITMHDHVSSTRVPSSTSSATSRAPPPPPPADDGPLPGAPPPQGSTKDSNEHLLPAGNPIAALINQAKSRKSGPKFLVSESVKEVSRTNLHNRVSSTGVPAALPSDAAAPPSSVPSGGTAVPSGVIPPPPPPPPMPPLLLD